MKARFVSANAPWRLRRLASSWVPALIIALIGSTLAITAYINLRDHERARLKTDFHQTATAYVTAFTLKLARQKDGLDGVRRFFESSAFVSRDEFNTFVGLIDHNHKDLYATAWIPRVPARNRKLYAESARQDGLTGFHFFPEHPDDDELLPIYYLNHEAQTDKLLGFDLGADPKLRAALEMARDTGEPAAGYWHADLDSEMPFDLFLLMPVYMNGATIDSLADRQTFLEGFVMQLANLSDVLKQAIAGIELSGIDIDIMKTSAHRTSAPTALPLQMDFSVPWRTIRSPCAFPPCPPTMPSTKPIIPCLP